MKALLIGVGILGGYVAFQTGELARAAYEGSPTMKIILLHETLAKASLITYSLAALSYLIAWIHIEKLGERIPPMHPVLDWLSVWQLRIFRTPVLMLLSLIGFVLLIIVGALGAVIVYGPNTDPAVTFIYAHLFPNGI